MPLPRKTVKKVVTPPKKEKVEAVPKAKAGPVRKSNVISADFDEYEEISDEQEDPDIKSVQRSSITTTDWTVDTLVSQLQKGNIELSPQFQRRFAWQDARKSQFIESLALNYPVPHIVLARDKNSPGKLIVLDGKQRLMTLAQFYGVKKLGTIKSNLDPLTLTSLRIKKAWNKETYASIKKKNAWKEDLDLFENSTIRSVIVTTWESEEYLYSIFVRLNLGSLPLSPQELRQALKPGEFTSFADKYAGGSTGLRKVLGLTKPDFRMRDVELLIRFLAFHSRSKTYNGNLKNFLDATCDTFNKDWVKKRAAIDAACLDLEAAITLAISIFGDGKVFRKYLKGTYETRINRAVFDVVAYAFSYSQVRTQLNTKAAQEKIRVGFEKLCSQTDFLRSIESTTKSLTATNRRFNDFLKLVNSVTGLKIKIDIPTP